MSAAVETVHNPQTIRTEGRPDLHHTTCCMDDDTALCGEDVSTDPWTDGTGDHALLPELEVVTDTCPRFRECIDA